MDSYHYTDDLGQAVEEARAAAEKANGLFGLLGDKLAAERESHRGEVLRQVERAEAAEREAERLAGVDAGLADAQARIADIERERDEERDARRDAEDRADDAERETRLAQDYQRETARELVAAVRRAERAEQRADELETEVRMNRVT